MNFPKRLYLLGPMTGYFNDNRPAFQLATSHLRALGFEVVSPDELDDVSPVHQPTWESLLNRDIPYLLSCEAGACLPGWRKSDGATLESTILTRLKRPIFELSDPRLHPYTLADLTEVAQDKLPQIVHPPELIVTTARGSVCVSSV